MIKLKKKEKINQILKNKKTKLKIIKIKKKKKIKKKIYPYSNHK